MKKRFLMLLAFVASLFTLTTAAYAEGTGTGVDAGTIKTAIDQVGIPTLIGAVALAMFSIYALIMGIRAVIAFLKRG
jgi:hypothetical protein